MCFFGKKINEDEKRKEIAKTLYDEMNRKYDDFVDFINKTEKYVFLSATKWYSEIIDDCYSIIQNCSFNILIGDVDEYDYEKVRKANEKVCKIIREAKASISDVINTMNENDNKFTEFCQREYCRFFVLEPLFSGPKRYCFSYEKEMYPCLKLGGNCSYFTLTIVDTTHNGAYVDTICSTDYAIRKMTKEEFIEIYLRSRCEENGFSNELELMEYEQGMNRLFDSENLE